MKKRLSAGVYELFAVSGFTAATSPVLRVLELGAVFGVTVRIFHGDIMDLSGDEDVCESPVTDFAFIEWRERALWLHKEEVPVRAASRREATALIHELGHLCACKHHPTDSKEYFFLGWEWQAAKRLGLESEWKESLLDYGFGAGAPWRLRVVEQGTRREGRGSVDWNREFRVSMLHAVRRGILAANGRMRSVIQ